jgi:hypothetical protein
MPPQVITYHARFTLPAPPAEVWASLDRFDRYEQWWRWLSELRADRPGLETGCTLDGIVSPPLPYRMRVRVTLLDCTAPRMLRAAVAGDLQGEAQLVLTPFRNGTRADVAWTVEMMQAPMRLVSRVARPVLLWGHDRVVEATVAGFRRHLQRQGVAGSRR